MTNTETLEARATKARKAVYIATDHEVAKDIDNIIEGLLTRIKELEAENRRLRQLKLSR